VQPLTLTWGHQPGATSFTVAPRWAVGEKSDKLFPDWAKSKKSLEAKQEDPIQSIAEWLAPLGVSEYAQDADRHLASRSSQPSVCRICVFAQDGGWACSLSETLSSPERPRSAAVWAKSPLWSGCGSSSSPSEAWRYDSTECARRPGDAAKVDMPPTPIPGKLGEEYRGVKAPTLDPVSNWTARAESIPHYLDGAKAGASLRAAITKSNSCRPPIFRVVHATSQKTYPKTSSG
jgi:hypothetical protein